MTHRIGLEEAARLLATTPATVRRWVRQGLLRSEEGAGEPTFRRATLEAWARRVGLRLSPGPAAPAEPAPDLLADAIARGAYVRGVPARSAVEVIEAALAALGELAPAQREELLAAVLERERMASTGIGHGVAVPHPRRPPGHLVREPVVSLVLPAEPVDWAALDGEPVFACVLLLSPDAPRHLELLSRVAIALRAPGLAGLLREAPEREVLLARLRELQRE